MTEETEIRREMEEGIVIGIGIDTKTVTDTENGREKGTEIVTEDLETEIVTRAHVMADPITENDLHRV